MWHSVRAYLKRISYSLFSFFIRRYICVRELRIKRTVAEWNKTWICVIANCDCSASLWPTRPTPLLAHVSVEHRLDFLLIVRSRRPTRHLLLAHIDICLLRYYIALHFASDATTLFVKFRLVSECAHRQRTNAHSRVLSSQARVPVTAERENYEKTMRWQWPYARKMSDQSSGCALNLARVRSSCDKRWINYYLIKSL